MASLFCTAKYRKTFGIPDALQPKELPHGALDPWYANTLNVGPQRYLHYMSSQTLLSVVITLKDRSSAEPRFARGLAELLRALGVPEYWVEPEISLLSSNQYARATDRSILGSMNDQAFLAHGRLSDGSFSLSEVNLRLSETPCGPLKYDSPGRLSPERLAATWRWSSAPS